MLHNDEANLFFLKAPFSILGRIVWNATTVGVFAKQKAIAFQYPRTDRVECYLWLRCSLPLAYHFQYPRTDRVECYQAVADVVKEYATFSILGRIVWNATNRWHCKHTLAALRFQYPRTDRVECYYVWRGLQRRAALRFQYPRTDRVECYAVSASRRRRGADFQYPRTDRVECYSRGSQGKPGEASFQYPRTDRVECYSIEPRGIAPRPRLSVSSDGSCGMLLMKSLHPITRTELSVSSDGSCGMLPSKWPPTYAEYSNFQYPRTDRVECYCSGGGLDLFRRFFQYPRTDRVECYRQVSGCARMPPVVFQYPRTDRVECYHLTRSASLRCAGLSVSSDGSCGMLHGSKNPVGSSALAFSILGRIVWNATFEQPPAPEPPAFSILGRIVWNATLGLPLASPATGYFQYPRTDRVECYKRQAPSG